MVKTLKEGVAETAAGTQPRASTSTPTFTTTSTSTSTCTSVGAIGASHDEVVTPYKKRPIPRALREQVWLKTFGRVYQHKCHISWCRNTITVFDFHMGHDIPESKGGETTITNLKPICSRCNLSMSDDYTIKDWEKFGYRKSHWWERLLCIGSP